MFVLLFTAKYESIPMLLNTSVIAFLLWLLTWMAGEVTIVLSDTYLLTFLLHSLSEDPNFCQKHEKLQNNLQTGNGNVHTTEQKLKT